MDYGMWLIHFNFVAWQFLLKPVLVHFVSKCDGASLRTLPAGYMELGESAVEGAVRETWEEANAEVEVEAPFAQLDIPQIGQAQQAWSKSKWRSFFMDLMMHRYMVGTPVKAFECESVSKM